VSIVQQIGEYLDSAWSTPVTDLHEWTQRVATFLSAAGLPDAANEFRRLAGEDTSWSVSRAKLVGFLEGLIQAQSAVPNEAGMKVAQVSTQKMHLKRVFVVHGRDTEAKELVARFLERLGLEPIILHEQPNSGRTVIEKFEVHADVGFAVVLLTPDDVGGLATDQKNLNGRARQNVILELGYFIGKLTRRRVCALYKNGVEIPSDYQGVLYLEFDVAGAWRTKLAQELVEAGFGINLEGLLKS